MKRHVASELAEAAAKKRRDTEAAALAAEEDELNEVIEVMQRAVAILEKQMGRKSLIRPQDLEQALAGMVQARAITTEDAMKVHWFVVTQASCVEPKAAACCQCKSTVGGIVDTLKAFLDDATAQLAAKAGGELGGEHSNG